MENPGQGIRLRSSARTSTGQVRENNEDNVHLWARDQFVLAIVADGMGGAAAGEEASRIAIETIHKDLASPDGADHQRYKAMDEDTLTDRLMEAIHAANLNIVQRAVSFPELKGMGTTVTLALVRETHVIVAHVGDSRAYIVDGFDGEITQVTSDHSFVEALVAAGHITREEAEDHPMKNVLYRALGQSEHVDVDVYYHRLHSGDRLVLCSDGLTRHVKPAEIAQIAVAEENPDVTSQKLIDLANSRGGEDNISVVVVKVEQDSAAKPSQIQAVMAMDDDDTLLLKDRLRLGLNDTESTPMPDRQTPPPEARFYSSSSLDSEDFSPLPYDPIDSLTPPASIPDSIIEPSKEADGEGRDMSTPEH